MIPELASRTTRAVAVHDAYGFENASKRRAYFGKSPLQDLGDVFIHSSSQKPHFEQPPTIRLKIKTVIRTVIRFNMRASLHIT